MISVLLLLFIISLSDIFCNKILFVSSMNILKLFIALLRADIGAGDLKSELDWLSDLEEDDKSLQLFSSTSTPIHTTTFEVCV